MSGPVLFSFLVASSVMTLFLAARQLFVRARDPIEMRLEAYGLTETGDPIVPTSSEPRRRWAGINRLMQQVSWGPRLATQLTRADLPMTAAEFAVLLVTILVGGYAAGTILSGSVVGGLILAATAGIIPLMYVRYRENRRRDKFTEQLPEVLTLLVGGLRAGYGLSQSMGIVVERMPAPASTEFARVVRAVGFGFPIQTALRDMADRIGLDDLDMVVTAISVQYELGGNLAQTLDTISETVRERLRIFREIRTLTAHQRFTATVLAGEPVALAIFFYILAPDHVGKLFEPGWIRLLPITAVLMMGIGYMIMRRIVDIKV